MIQDGTCLADVFTAAAPSPSASLVTAGVLADNKTPAGTRGQNSRLGLFSTASAQPPFVPPREMHVSVRGRCRGGGGGLHISR